MNALPFDIRLIADAIGYPAAGLGILIESAGIPFPGETMLLAVSAYAALVGNGSDPLTSQPIITSGPRSGT